MYESSKVLTMALAEQFEDLRIWQAARQAFAELHPDAKVFEYYLRDQILRAALSVMNNIAEGFERRSNRDFRHFLGIAKASAGEVRSILYAVQDVGLLDLERSTFHRKSYRRLSASIAAFSRTLKV